MNILVVTPYFPPDSHIASNRWKRLGVELAGRGHEVKVATIDHPEKGFLGQRKLGNHPPEVVEVIRIPLPVSDLVRAYLSLLVLIPLHTFPKKFLALPQKPLNLLRNLVSDVSILWAYPEFRKSWIRCAFRKLKEINFFEKVDIVIGSHPFSSMLTLANRIHRHLGIPWVADFRDPWSRDPQGSGWVKTQLLFNTERQLLKQANAVVAINQEMASMLEVSKAVDVVPNCYENRVMLRAAALGRSRLIQILYAGNLLQFANWPMFFNALEKLGRAEKCVEIRYYGPKYSQIQHFRDSLLDKGIVLSNKGFVSQAEVIDEARKSDMLLLFGWNGAGKECVVTGKVFDYLQSGRPIIAITEKETALGRMIEETKAGIVLDSEAAIIQLFKQLFSEGESVVRELEERMLTGSAEAYSVENCASKYEAILNRCIENERRSS